MKRTFLAKRNAFLSSASISWGGYALIVAVLFFLVRLITPNFFWHVLQPVFQSADALAAGSHTLFSGFGDVAKLSQENETLLSENNALTNENQALLQKTADLEALLGAPSTGKKTSGILAGVVVRPPESPYDTLILSEGSNAGIARGQEVFGAGDIPLGVVSSVLADFSRVTLFSSPGVSMTGWVGAAHVPLTIVGSGAGSMSASVARSAGVAVGDTIFGPGPGMLPIGTVARIDDDPSSPSLTLHLTPKLNLFSVSWVIARDTGAALLDALHATSTPL